MLRRAAALLIPTAIAWAALLAPAPAAAQSGGFVITSQPPGAVVELSGEHVLRGVTPWRLDRAVAGPYEVRAAKSGYELWEAYTVLSGVRPDSLHIRLVRKTPFRAGLRSAILPGWGQHYTGQSGKGTAFMVAEAAALAGVLWTDARRQNAQQDYDDAQAAYESVDQIEEIEEAYAELLRRYDELNKWHEYRKRWSYAAAAVWLANVLDAALLFPSPGGGSFSAAPGGDSGFFASVEPERTEFGIALRF